jgi:DNA-binding winged helix-turn-helix (wHTH) protein/tetratricopeptide (TPR) repeat protein
MSSRFYEFGPFRVDAMKRRLLCQGEVVSLTPKVFETLLVFVQNSGTVLGKDDLMQLIWPDTVVEEANLTQNVSVLRRVLGESAEQRKYVITIPGRGYRFVADVREMEDEDGDFIVEKRTRSRIIVEDVVETLAPAKTICVLPFKLLGATNGDEYLGVGIADALITKLGNISKIIVRPTSAVLKYALSDQDPVLAGRELRVEAVLEGSIQRHRDRIRVTAQFVSVCDAETLWAGKFDEVFTDIFSIEDRVSEQIMRALMLRLTGEEQKRLTKHHTESAEAYQLYLKGLYFANKMTKQTALKAIEHFTRAIELDPNYALAYAGLADSYACLSYLYISPNEAMPKARAAAEKAIEIDEGVGEAHYALAQVKMRHDWDWYRCEKEFKRAIELSPNHALAHTWYGFFLTAMGRFDEAISQQKLAIEIDPLSLFTYSAMGWSLYFEGDYDGAVEHFSKALDLDPTFHNAYWGLGWSYIWKQQYEESIAHFEKLLSISGGAEIIGGLGHAKAKAGRKQEALELIAKLQELSQQHYVSPFYIALIYSGLGDKDNTIKLLYRAYEDRFDWLVQIKVDPAWDFLSSEPRFTELLARIGV